MAVSASIETKIRVTETFTGDTLGTSNASVVHGAFNATSPTVLNASSTPPATKYGGDSGALVAGAATLDLTAVPNAASGAQDMTGLKVQVFRFQNTGAATITISEGASNGYAIWGASGGPVKVPAGGKVTIEFNDGSPDVASGDKTIDLAGTGTDTFKWEVVCG